MARNLRVEYLTAINRVLSRGGRGAHLEGLLPKPDWSADSHVRAISCAEMRTILQWL